MKQKNTDLVPYIFLMVFAVILTGIIIYSMKNFFDSTTAVANEVVDSTEKIASEYTDYEITMYDGEEVRGSQVTNFIKKQLGDYSSSETAPIYVEVTTILSNNTYTNQYANIEHLPDIKNFSGDQYYIKPTAWFNCKVVESVNGAILGISFVQK